jgi:hypothetical protein
VEVEDHGELAGSAEEEEEEEEEEKYVRSAEEEDHGEHSGSVEDEQIGSVEKRLRSGFAVLASYFPIRWLV